MAKKVTIINGPNLNLLGTREPDKYGNKTLDQINDEITKLAKDLGVEPTFFQSNNEGEIVDEIQRSAKAAQGIIINPAAYSHTSVAIRDALAASSIPVIEVHLSNIYAREDFRHHSYVSAVATGIISGLGSDGYLLAIRALASKLG